MIGKRYFSKPGLIFFLIVSLAFSLRVIYLSQTANFIQPGSGSDGHFYLQWARDIVSGNILGRQVFYALPAYPYFLSLAYLFAGGGQFELVLLQLVLGAVNCALIYLLGRKLFNFQVGLIAGSLACFYEMFIFYDRMFLPSTLAIFAGLLLLFLLLKAQQTRAALRIWFAAGLFIGICALTAASFALLAILVLVWMGQEYRKLSWSRTAFYALSFFLPFLLVIGGVTLRNYLVARDPVLITAHSGINFYLGNNPQANGLFKVPPYLRPTQAGLVEDAHIVAEGLSGLRLSAAQASRFWLSRSLRFISTQPLEYLRLSGRKLALFWNGKEYIDDVEYYIFREDAKLFKLPLVKFGLICPLAILGICLSWPLRRQLALLYLFTFGLMSAAITFFINARYRLLSLPYLLLFAGFGIWQIWERWRTKKIKKFILLCCSFAVLYLLTNIDLFDSQAGLNLTEHYNKGVFFSDQNDQLNAKLEFLAALEINPRDFMSYFGLGNVYFKLKDYSRAIDNFKKSAALNPYFYDAYFNLGLVYAELKDYSEAEQQLKKVIALKPRDYAAYYNLGQIYQVQGLDSLAWEAYQMALEIEPEQGQVIQAVERLKNRVR